MRTILLTMLAGILMISCGPSKEEIQEMQRAAAATENACNPKYKMGDVVEIKPDSERVVVINIEPEYCPSVVYWVRKAGGDQIKIQEELIYHKE